MYLLVLVSACSVGMMDYDSGCDPQKMPYDAPLRRLGELSGSGGNLVKLDLDGVLDYNCMRYCFGNIALRELHQCGVSVNLGTQTQY